MDDAERHRRTQEIGPTEKGHLERTVWRKCEREPGRFGQREGHIRYTYKIGDDKRLVFELNNSGDGTPDEISTTIETDHSEGEEEGIIMRRDRSIILQPERDRTTYTDSIYQVDADGRIISAPPSEGEILAVERLEGDLGTDTVTYDRYDEFMRLAREVTSDNKSRVEIDYLDL